MLAARVLADTFEQVTIIERHEDRSVSPPALAQVFSEPARSQLERLFAGLSAELTADGAAVGVPVSRQGPTRPVPGVKRDSPRLQFTQRFIQRHLTRRLNKEGKGLAVAARQAANLHRLLGETYVETTADRSRLVSWRYFDAVQGCLMDDRPSAPCHHASDL